MDIQKVEQTIEIIFQDLTPPNRQLDGVDFLWLFDRERHHYQLQMSGWEDSVQILSILVQIDIKDNLVWVQADNTDYGVVEALERHGIPKNQIVLGFHSAFKRPYTGYAVG
jgi:hypothetical protein